MSFLIDTHAHLYAEEFTEDLSEMMQRGNDAGLRAILLPNIDVSSIEPMEKLAAEYPQCIQMMGLHPTYVKENWEEELKTIEEKLFANPSQYCAVGEIGMDLYWDKTFLEEQQQFLNNVQSPQAQTGPSQEELAAQQEQSRKIISEGISSVVNNNIIKIGANGEGINYQIQDPNVVVDYAMDSNKFLSIFAKDGSVDWDKWTKTVAFAQNPTQFISELIKHGKSLGRKAMESELKNVVPPTINKTVVESNNIERPSDDPIAFLQGMTITKK
jgi:hypothetical protein